MSSKRNPAASNNWQTPAGLAGLVDDFANYRGFDRITLDPATTKENPMGAEFIRTPDCDPDGLQTQWFDMLYTEPRFVYVNPPYQAAWYAKIHLEGVRMRGAHENCHMIALLPAKPGTQYFANLMGAASANCFVTGRLTFRGAAEPAPFESSLMYWGNKPHHFRAHFEELGWVI